MLVTDFVTDLLHHKEGAVISRIIRAARRVSHQADVVRHEAGQKKATAQATRRDHVALRGQVRLGKEAVRASDRHQRTPVKKERQLIGGIG
jgi:hypothetical protein